MNYQKWLDEELEKNRMLGKKPRLFLHCCCAPCSSYVFEYLCAEFDITAYFYNPNISDEAEYLYRAEELKRLICEMPEAKNVKLIVAPYGGAAFLELANGREHLPEGGARCYDCYQLRLEETARAAKDGAYDYFATTLSISPHKNAEWLNNIGKALSTQYGVPYLYSDFKKKNGYKRSCELSRQYNLYRQSFCGCKFSKQQSLER